MTKQTAARTKTLDLNINVPADVYQEEKGGVEGNGAETWRSSSSGLERLSARMNIVPTKHPYIMQKHPFIISNCVSLTDSRETLKAHTQIRLLSLLKSIKNPKSGPSKVRFWRDCSFKSSRRNPKQQKVTPLIKAVRYDSHSLSTSSRFLIIPSGWHVGHPSAD